MTGHREQESTDSGSSFVQAIAGGLMIALTILFAALSGFYWPDTSGPPQGKPTIAGMEFNVDKPNINGGVRVLINPWWPVAMTVYVDLDVPRGETVHWNLNLSAVVNDISLKEVQSASRNPGRLIKAPVTYILPLPTDMKVRDYLLAGQVEGPSSAYTQLMSASASLPSASSDTSITTITWSGTFPYILQGAYVTVSLPSLISPQLTYPSHEGFDPGWKPFRLKKFHAVEQLALPADYQINSGTQVSEGFAGWTWTSDTPSGIVNATGVGSSISLQADIQHRSFLAGIFVALAASAFFASIPFFVAAVHDKGRRSKRRRRVRLRNNARRPSNTEISESA